MFVAAVFRLVLTTLPVKPYTDRKFSDPHAFPPNLVLAPKAVEGTPIPASHQELVETSQVFKANETELNPEIYDFYKKVFLGSSEPISKKQLRKAYHETYHRTIGKKTS